ncbi:MAG TPA: extracellular solute-binding protein [Candidatus Acidoferrales bacterium]|nr:extracellular solute-binding protein [Candidatus Acidoferrales bacterium]
MRAKAIIRLSALVFFFTALSLGESAAGQAGDWRQEWEKSLAAARKEGQLVIYGSADYEKLFGEFGKKYPAIKVSGFFGRGADVAKRVIAERRADKYLADLYLDGMTTGYNVLYKGKAVDPIAPVLLLPEVVDSSKWWQGKHQYVDPEQKYLFIFNGEIRIVVAYNRNLLNPEEVRSYWDLLNPKWKGKIVALDPMSGGSGDALRFFYHSPSLGREFIRRLLTEMDVVISGDSRQMGDWIASGKYAVSIFGPVSRMDLDLAKEQGLPVDWFRPDQLKEGAYITAGSGGVALMNRAPHPNAAKIAINWLLSREGQILYQKIFRSGEDGPDSMRIDIPKDMVPKRNLRPPGDESKYPLMDRAELMDMEPVRKFVRDVLAQRGR